LAIQTANAEFFIIYTQKKLMKCFLLLSFIILASAILFPNTFAQESANIPDWIKNNAGWWASDQIPDSAFLQGIQYLINEGIMVIPLTELSESPGSEDVPVWVKNVAGWWANDNISELEFVNAIQYLIKNGIININDNSSCVNDLSKIFDDSTAVLQDICNLHASSEYSELVPFAEKYTINNLGFRGPEFSEIKPLNTYRIFMVGGSTLVGSGGSSDETTIPGILQKIFDSDSSVQKIEVINAGANGANAVTELNLILDKLLWYQPNLVIIYDGWNDLKADHAVTQTKYNWEVMCKLGKIHDFDVIISLQPLAGFGNKKLTHQEIVNSFTGEDNYGFQLITAKSTYDYMARELLSLQDNCNVINLRGIFDDISGPIYWDQGHVSDTANLILAEKFYEIINETIFDKKSNDNKFHKIVSKYNSPIITSYLLSKIDIDVDYTQIKKQDLSTVYKKDGNYFYLKNHLGGSEKILVGKDLSKTDLSKVNLTGQDLSSATLSGQDLREIDFTGTILRGADLSFTNLSGQNLSGRDIQGINFHGANLENVDLTDIIISRMIQFFEVNPNNPSCSHPSDYLLDMVFLNRCSIQVIKNESIRTDFSNTNMKGVTINLSAPNNYIHFVDFSGADLTGIDFSDLTFQACKFNGTNFNNNNISNVGFLLCIFDNAEFINSHFSNTVFQDVSFHNAKIIDGSFNDIYFLDYVNLSDADLSGTSIVGLTTLGDIDLRCKNNQICE
tara:strand:+ start:414 stop:2609 length:2196 start_codon:yes stop_codon:yes gene_type:complete